jgi:hypothetical protein
MRSLVRSLLYGAGVALVAVACGDSFRAEFGDGGANQVGTDASMSDGGSSSSDGASSGGASSGGASSGGVSDGGRSASGGASGSTASGGANIGTGGGKPVTSGGGPSVDGGGDAGAPAAGGNPATGGNSASGGNSSGGKPATGGNGGNGGGPTTSPISTDGLMLWLRADKGITSSSNLVSRWADQSPSHLDAAQATTSLQPVISSTGINGHPAVVFDGVDDFLQISKSFDVETGAVTVFTVVMMPDTSVCSAMFESSNGAEDNDISLGSYMQKVNWEVYNTADESSAFDQGVPVIVSGSSDTDGTGFVMYNGVLATTLSNFDSPAKLPRLQTFIGKTLYADCQTLPGSIGEVIVYNRALPLEEMLAVQKYLGNEFGCCVN